MFYHIENIGHKLNVILRFINKIIYNSYQSWWIIIIIIILECHALAGWK